MLLGQNDSYESRGPFQHRYGHVLLYDLSSIDLVPTVDGQKSILPEAFLVIQQCPGAP